MHERLPFLISTKTIKSFTSLYLARVESFTPIDQACYPVEVDVTDDLIGVVDLVGEEHAAFGAVSTERHAEGI